MDDVTIDPVDEATHRRLAADLFNRSWQLLELENRTPAQDDELVHVVHAAAFHWGEVGNAGAPCTGREPVRARVFGTRPPRSCAPSCAASARVGARRRRRLRGLGPGHRARSRCTRHLAAGNRSEADHYVALAQSELDKVADPEDREIIGSQLTELNL